MPPISPLLLEDLAAVVGPMGMLTAPGDLPAYTADWRGAHRGRAAAVVRPASTAEVAEVVRRCHLAGVAVVPQGGNTGLCGGATPDETGDQVVLQLGRLRRIRDVDPVEDTITVEAGAVLRDVQASAAAVGRLFPLSLGSEGSCTIGGNLATNAGGTAVLRYGMVRDLALGLEVVLPDGRIWDGLRPLRKDNAGYDLKQLFIGAEGTLGVITAAVLRLVPATPRRVTAWVALPDVDAAVAVLGVLREHGGSNVTAWELMSHEALSMVLATASQARNPLAAPHPWYGLVELAGPDGAVGLTAELEAALSEAFARDLLLDAVVAGSPAQRAALWSLREGISEAQNLHGPSLKHDVTVPIRRLPAFVAATASALDDALPGVRLVTYGHVGDGNLHFNLSLPPGLDPAAFLGHSGRLSKVVYDAVAAAGGSISAEHGIGTAKRAIAATYLDPVELELMRAVKRALDPRGLMNPGKVVLPG
ncbi:MULTISPECIES: FAD-binding oxidoreductase [Nocardioides]|uniref:FAD-binding oxidoreductase n=1 Tax=Nocardioides vastitatis TaxID=2568655 RepID=A0ABW0ZI36_9ACTN|nr:FAD-binding oxidoreductase [Nocardioides sp.]THI98322.1 FAD-binding oxidoreductase [Nocardioides sp.]